MCPNPETVSARKARSALRSVVLVLVITVAIVGVSAPYGAARAQSAPVTYTVVPGDSLAKIAAKHGLAPATGWRLVYDANPSIANPHLIMPGQQLRIPAPGEQVPGRPLTPRAPKAAAGGSVWDRLAQCESSGNWSSNVGTFDGGLQFLPSTWRAYGGAQYAPYANQATRQQQIAVAERVLAGQGWRAWPACSRKLGLR